MSLWDEVKGTLANSLRYGDGLGWRFIGAGLLIGDQQEPAAGDRGLVDDVFFSLGDELRAAATVVPIELLASCVCTEAEVNGRVVPPTSRTLPGFVDDETTPHLHLIGCTGLRLDIAQSLGASLETMAVPATALDVTATHIAATASETHFAPPMVASAFNATGVRFDNASPFRMASFDGDITRIGRFCSWFSTITTLCLGDSSNYAGALSFAETLIAMTPPPVPGPSASTSSGSYRLPASQAAIDAGMMVQFASNSSLSTIWALDDTTLTQIKGVANDSASGLGLPGGFPVFAYPDRAGVQRVMTGAEVEALYRAMRDYVAAIRMFDVGRAASLPGQPVYIA
jgi:hypothetical protein